MITAFKAFMDEVITVTPVTFDEWNKPIDGTPFTIKGRIQSDIRLVSNREGNEQLSNAFILADYSGFIDPSSKITLPVGFVPQVVSIISASPVTGPNGENHHIKIRI